MGATIEQLETLFMGAGRAHHTDHVDTGLDNPHWAGWYAAFLLNDLNKALNRSMTEEQLTEILLKLDKKFREEKPEIKWPRFYAEQILAFDSF